MSNTLKKLNLGCGPNGLDDWINYDWGVLPLFSKLQGIRQFGIRLGLLDKKYDIRWPKIKLVDIRKRLPLQDETIDCIYCSHVLEHLERWEALFALKESFRVLVRGGRIRIAVPDLEYICRHYLDSRSVPVVQGRPAQDACRLLWGHPKDIEPGSWFSKWSRRFIRGHEWAYDESEMTKLLAEAGFSEIERCTFRKGNVPDLDRLDLTDHAAHSLYMEASKH